MQIIYEDNDLAAVNKPTGENFDWALKEMPELLIVHRLDKETSGVILFAKNEKTQEYLRELFKTRKIQKSYKVLVIGLIKDKAGIIDLSIGRSKKTPLKRVAIGEKRGKIREAVTEYKVLRKFVQRHMKSTWTPSVQVGFTLIEAFPKTGRTHQIRSHFAAIGHPVVCDKLYSGKRFICPGGLSRQFLHASSVEFALASGARIKLEADMPEDLERTLQEISDHATPAPK